MPGAQTRWPCRRQVSDTGALYTFGRNANGQLGNGSTDDSPSPVLVTALEVREPSARPLGPTTTVADYSALTGSAISAAA